MKGKGVAVGFMSMYVTGLAKGYYKYCHNCPQQFAPYQPFTPGNKRSGIVFRRHH